MIWDFGEIIAGLVLLVVAGDLLVKGAVAMSLRLGIPALIVGLTVVAFGTSAPELMVSVAAVLDKAPSMALGNVVGSNIANILLVLGLPAMISAIRTDLHDTRESFVLMMGATVLFILVCFMGPIGWAQALLLLFALGIILFRQIREARAHRANRGNGNEAETEADEEVESVDPNMPLWRIGLYVLAGLVGLPLGASWLVSGASEIASAMGVSDAVIGLTLVALGTSLPELATTIVSATRNAVDLAVGNIIGSNIFNLALIGGVTSVIREIPVHQEAKLLAVEMPLLCVLSLLLLPMMRIGYRIRRREGVVLLLIYATFLYLTVVL